MFQDTVTVIAPRVRGKSRSGQPVQSRELKRSSKNAVKTRNVNFTLSLVKYFS